MRVDVELATQYGGFVGVSGVRTCAWVSVVAAQHAYCLAQVIYEFANMAHGRPKQQRWVGIPHCGMAMLLETHGSD